MLWALDKRSPCRLWILRNVNVACLWHLIMPMLHVGFKKYPCRMSLYYVLGVHLIKLDTAIVIL